MLFPTVLSTTLLAFAVCVAAVPHANLKTGLVARGLLREPHSLLRRIDKAGKGKKNNGNQNIVITTTTETQLTEFQQGSEIQLTKILEKKLIIIDKTKQAQDNIRKNHFKNVNNIIIIVVTQIVDAANKQAVRYMTHQLKANDLAVSDPVFVQVNQAAPMTIDTAANATDAFGSNVSANSTASFAIYDPSAPLAPSNETQILPIGASAPQFAGAQAAADPAIIIEKDQAVFVGGL